MKIAIDARIINSGTGRYVERLLTYLEQLNTDHEFKILVKSEDLNYWRPRSSNFQLVTADFPFYGFEEQIGFKRLLESLAPDLVHFCMPQQPAYYRGRSVTTVHDLNQLRLTETDDMPVALLRFKQQVLRWLLRRVARTSQHIITPSEFTKQDFIGLTRIPASKVTVTYESADQLDAVASRPRGLTEESRFIMYVGRAEPYKNNRGLIRAHQLLLSKFPDLKLVIVGPIDTFRERDKKWAEQEGYSNVDFFGFAQNSELVWMYQHCRVYIVPSFMEGFGLPGLEAMVHGAPVASSDATCLPEVYGDGAAYFDAHNPSDMAKIIETIINDDKFTTKLRKAGSLRAETYSWKRMAEQTLAIYEAAARA